MVGSISPESSPPEASAFPLRVAIDAVSAAPGGGSSYLLHQLPALERAGAQLLVFARPEIVSQLATVLTGAAFIPVPLKSTFRRMAYSNIRLPKEAASWGAHVLYCPGSTGPILGTLPQVICIQNPNLFVLDAPRSLRLSLIRIITWWSAFRAAQLVHISQTMADQFAVTSGLSCPTRVIYSGAGGLRSPAGVAVAASRTRPYILAVSNFYHYKRMDVVVRAYLEDDLLRGGYDLVIAGAELESGITDHLLRLALVAHASDRVTLLGFVGAVELENLYRNADAYVSASEREAFPLTPAEALVAGTPVVLSDIPSFRELYRSWAIFARPGDPHDFALAIRRALQAEVPPCQVDAVLRCFSWERNAEALLDALRAAQGGGIPSFDVSLRRIDVRRLNNVAATLFGHGTVPW